MSARKKASRNACATCEFWNGPRAGTAPQSRPEPTAVPGADPCDVGFFDQYQRFSDDDCPQWRKWSGATD